MSHLTTTQELLKTLHLSESAHYLPTLIKEAEVNDMTYLSFLNRILEYEQKRREENYRKKD